jgi:hypothetical protein
LLFGEPKSSAENPVKNGPFVSMKTHLIDRIFCIFYLAFYLKISQEV